MFYKETEAERLFRESGPIVHLHTTSKEYDVFFHNDAERELALNFIAIATYLSGCVLLAFAVMDNHFHFVLMGTPYQVTNFWEEFRSRLDVFFLRHGLAGMLNDIQATPTIINSLSQLRTEISYVIRNPFVIRTDVHVFADRWSSGALYFNPLLVREGTSAALLKGRALRRFTCSRQEIPIEGRIFVKNGVAQMWSFVDYKMAERFFDNTRQFVNTVLKNVEAQVETARRLGEKPFLSDDELRPIVYKLCRESFGKDGPQQLEEGEKKKLAVLIKNEFSASNKQIARLAKMTVNEVNTLFPLSAAPPKR